VACFVEAAYELVGFSTINSKQSCLVESRFSLISSVTWTALPSPARWLMQAAGLPSGRPVALAEAEEVNSAMDGNFSHCVLLHLGFSR
jgi:hypothetical protein